MATAGTQIPRWQAWLLASAGAAVCIAAGVFIGYRSSSPPRERVVVVESAPGVASNPARYPETGAPSTPQPEGRSSLSGADRGGGPSEGRTATSESPSSTSDSPSMPEQVRTYFAETDRLLASAKLAGDPNTIARKILEQSASGDTSGLEQMLATQRALAQRLSAIVAPAPCAEHQRRSVALVEKSANMLAQVVGTFRSGDMSALLGLGVAGKEIESEARALDTMAADIRKQHGVQ